MKKVILKVMRYILMVGTLNAHVTWGGPSTAIK